MGAPRLHFYASAASLNLTAGLLERDCAPDGFLDPQVGERLNLELHQVEPLRPFAIGRYKVTAFPANHDPTVEALIYAVEADGQSILYGTDTAWLLKETWQAFDHFGMRFDVVILDHTYGPGEKGEDHLNAHGFIEQIKLMREGDF